MKRRAIYLTEGRRLQGRELRFGCIVAAIGVGVSDLDGSTGIDLGDCAVEVRSHRFVGSTTPGVFEFDTSKVSGGAT